MLVELKPRLREKVEELLTQQTDKMPKDTARRLMEECNHLAVLNYFTCDAGYICLRLRQREAPTKVYCKLPGPIVAIPGSYLSGARLEKVIIESGLSISDRSGAFRFVIDIVAIPYILSQWRTESFDKCKYEDDQLTANLRANVLAGYPRISLGFSKSGDEQKKPLFGVELYLFNNVPLDLRIKFLSYYDPVLKSDVTGGYFSPFDHSDRLSVTLPFEEPFTITLRQKPSLTPGRSSFGDSRYKEHRFRLQISMDRQLE